MGIFLQDFILFLEVKMAETLVEIGFPAFFRFSSGVRKFKNRIIQFFFFDFELRKLPKEKVFLIV